MKASQTNAPWSDGTAADGTATGDRLEEGSPVGRPDRHKCVDSRDVGLLILRLGMGVMFVGHGLPKLLGGPVRWQAVGDAMAVFGIEAVPAVWGLLAALAEVGGGLLFAVGYLFRPACAVLLTTMVVAAAMHIDRGDSFTVTSHAVESAILFLAGLWIGPGRLRLAVAGP